MDLIKDYVKQPVPYVNIGGTSFDNLFEGYSIARGMILDALDYMRQIAPHPRDYLETAHYNYAKLCYLRNLEVLQAVSDEYERLMEAIDANENK